MKTQTPRVTRGCRAVLIGALLAAAASSVMAQSGGGFDLTHHVVASGGTAQGGPYKLAAAAGQPAVMPCVTGGVYAHQPGFLQDADLFPVPVRVSHFALD